MPLYGLIVARSNNLGDDIQSLSVKLFLPRVDLYIDRENLNKIRLDSKIKVILNGWYTHNPFSWPPSNSIEPLIIGFHIDRDIARFFTRHEIVNYLRRYEPVGARDVWTMRFLQSLGVDAYFSGCVTLTLGRHFKANKLGKYILTVDVDPILLRSIKKYFNNFAIINLSNKIYNIKMSKLYKKLFNINTDSFMRSILTLLTNSSILIYSSFYREIISIDRRLKLAQDIIKLIAGASGVITSRLHIALPALAIGVPLIFVPPNPLDLRFSGYRQYFRFICSIDRFLYCLRNFKPEKYTIPNYESLAEIISNLEYKIKSFLN